MKSTKIKNSLYEMLGKDIAVSTATSMIGEEIEFILADIVLLSPLTEELVLKAFKEWEALSPEQKDMRQNIGGSDEFISSLIKSWRIGNILDSFTGTTDFMYWPTILKSELNRFTVYFSKVSTRDVPEKMRNLFSCIQELDRIDDEVKLLEKQGKGRVLAQDIEVVFDKDKNIIEKKIEVEIVTDGIGMCEGDVDFTFSYQNLRIQHQEDDKMHIYTLRLNV